MSPVAVPVMGLAFNLDDDSELVLIDEPTLEQRKAWSLEVYGTYRRSNYIFANVL